MKIGLCRTMSVGKTTIVNALKDKSNGLYKCFTERSKALMDEGVPLNQKSTYKGQLRFFSERAIELMYENMITDRTSIDVLSFSMVSDDIEQYEKAILKLIHQSLVKEYDLIIYVPIKEEIPMKDNNVRETDLTYRKLIDDTIVNYFEKYKGRKHILQTVGVENRVEEIINLIKEVENDNNS